MHNLRMYCNWSDVSICQDFWYTDNYNDVVVAAGADDHYGDDGARLPTNLRRSISDGLGRISIYGMRCVCNTRDERSCNVPHRGHMRGWESGAAQDGVQRTTDDHHIRSLSICTKICTRLIRLYHHNHHHHRQRRCCRHRRRRHHHQTSPA